MQAYSFTSAPIAKALVETHKRGVEVQVILDKSQKTEKYSEADFVAHHGIPVLIDSRHAINHNKVMIIDGQTVITGSFNFTKSAEENNAENLVIIRDGAIAGKYAANWREHAAHSEPYERDADTARAVAARRQDARAGRRRPSSPRPIPTSSTVPPAIRRPRFPCATASATIPARRPSPPASGRARSADPRTRSALP